MYQSKTLILVILLVVVGAVPAFASDPIVWDIGSRAELLKGEARGISINDTGVITLAPEATPVFNTEQPYVWSSAIDAAGNVYLGTGHDGKLFRIGSDGKGSLLFKASELDVTALAIAKDGSVFAATSPDGKVYRVTADGKSEVYFDPEDKYIWSLAMLNDGSLAVGTGDNGKLYRVRAAGAKPAESLLIDTNQTHVMSLAVTPGGDLIAGTDPGGLVLRVSSTGKAFALYDAPLREIHALAAGPDGSIYALGLGDSAATTKATAGTDATSAAVVTVTTTDESAAAQGTPPTPARSRNDLSNARSAVFHILPDGGTDIVWSSTTVTGFAVLATKGGVLIGTSDKGRVYSVTDSGRDTLLLQTTEGQISSLMTRGSDVFAASSNQGKLIRFGASKVKDGSYESPVRDARIIASWGKVWWRGAGPIELQTRSGNSERPDMTWSDWSTSYTDRTGVQISSPRARFIQWRAVLKGAGTAEARLDDVSLAYLPRNVAPEVIAITIMPAGVALQQQIQMPVDPNIEASGLDASIFGFVAQAPPRKVFQRGARSLQWQAEDRNGDTLEFAVFYRALNESNFRLLKDHLRETFYTVDGASLADGQYVFRVVASDDLDNPAAMALAGDRISEPVDIDNTPPVVRSAGQVQANGDRVHAVFDVEDTTGRIKRADVSIDGSQWREVFPDDGIADSGKERYSLDLNVLGPGEHTISLRAFDNSNNAGNISLTFRR
jgi:hypothetical protein